MPPKGEHLRCARQLESQGFAVKDHHKARPVQIEANAVVRTYSHFRDTRIEGSFAANQFFSKFQQLTRGCMLDLASGQYGKIRCRGRHHRTYQVPLTVNLIETVGMSRERDRLVQRGG